MATIDDFTTPEQGWGLVHHFIGNTVFKIRTAMEKRSPGWEGRVAGLKKGLAGRLFKILKKLLDNGYGQDATNVGALSQMVKIFDLTDPMSQHILNHREEEYDPQAIAPNEFLQENTNSP